MVHDSFSASRHDPGMKCFSVFFNCLFVSLFVCLFYISIFVCVCFFSLFSVYLFVSLSVCLLVYSSVHGFVCLSVFLIVCWSVGPFFFLYFCLFINLLFGWFVHFFKNIFDDTFHHLDRNPNVHIFAINPVQKTSMDLHLCESHQQSRHPFHLRGHS